MNIFLIYNGQELGADVQKAIAGANLTLIADEGAAVPVALLPVFAKTKSLNLLPIKSKDPFMLGLAIGQNFKSGDKVIAPDKTMNEAVTAFLGGKPAKKQRAPRQQSERIELPAAEKGSEPSKKETNEAPGAMPKPIEEAPKPVEKEPPVNYSNMTAKAIKEPHDEKDKKFEKAFKESGISNKYKEKTLELYKIATDKTSRNILSKDIGDIAQRQKVLELLDKIKPLGDK